MNFHVFDYFGLVLLATSVFGNQICVNTSETNLDITTILLHGQSAILQLQDQVIGLKKLLNEHQATITQLASVVNDGTALHGDKGITQIFSKINYDIMIIYCNIIYKYYNNM